MNQTTSKAGFSLIEVLVSMAISMALMMSFITFMAHQQKGVHDIISKTEIARFHSNILNHFDYPQSCQASFAGVNLSTPASISAINHADGSKAYDTMATDYEKTYANHSLKIQYVELSDWVSNDPGDDTVKTGSAQLKIIYLRLRDGYGPDEVIRIDRVYTKVKSAQAGADFMDLDDCSSNEPDANDEVNQTGFEGFDWLPEGSSYGRSFGNVYENTTGKTIRVIAWGETGQQATNSTSWARADCQMKARVRPISSSSWTTIARDDKECSEAPCMAPSTCRSRCWVYPKIDVHIPDDHEYVVVANCNKDEWSELRP